MPITINQWFAYLSTDKAELQIKDMKSVVRGGKKNADIGTYILQTCRIVRSQPPESHMPNTINQCVAYLAALSTYKAELHIKAKKWVVRGSKKLQTLELTSCSHVGLSLIATRNSHAKHNQSVVRIPEVRKRDMG